MHVHIHDCNRNMFCIRAETLQVHHQLVMAHNLLYDIANMRRHDKHALTKPKQNNK